jgi:phytoene dehydrogenase-like protein
MSEHFDVCVLGGQPAGFLCAALLAKRGKRVAIVDHGEGFDTYRQGGVTYPLLPQPLIGLRGFGFADKTLHELGAQVDLPRRYISAQPALQVIFPRHRLDLDGDRKAVKKEAEREFGGAADPFSSALDQLDAMAKELEMALAAEDALPLPSAWQRFWQVRRLKQNDTLGAGSNASSLFAGLETEHPLAQLLVESAKFATHLDTPNLPIGVQALLAQRTLSGSVRLDSSGGSYLDALAELVTRAGGTVRRGATIERIDASGNKITSLDVGGINRLSLTADYFVNALYSHQLWQNLPQSRALGKFFEQNARLRPRSKLYFHHLLVKQEGLPVGLGDNVLLMNGRQQTREGTEPDGAVWVTVRRDHTKEHALLSAAIEVKENDASSLPEQLGAQRKRVRKQLERLMPFLPPFIDAESSPMAQSEWDEQAGGGGARRLDPWLLHPRYEPLPEALLGVSGLPFHTPYRNLFRVGRETLPGLGWLGDFVSARMTTAIISKSPG